MSLDGLWRFALDPGGVGRAERWWTAPLPGDARDAGARQLQRRRRRRASRATTSATSGTSATVRVPRGWDGRADRAALRRGHAPGDGRGSATPRSPSTRAATRRSRPTSPSTCEPGERGAGHGRGQQRAVVAVDPARLRRGARGRPPRQRYFHDFFNYAGLHRSVWLYTTPRVARQRRHRQHDRDRRRDRRRRLPSRRRRAATSTEVRVAVRDAGGDEVARADGSRGRAAHRRTCSLWRPGEGYLYTLDVEVLGRADERRRRLPAAVRHPHGRGRRAPVPDQRRAVLLHRVRQARGLRGPRQRPRRRGHGRTTSRCWSGSARTRSGRRTTPTPRRSSTTPTATASSSSTRRPPSGSTSNTGTPILGEARRSTTYSEETISARTQEVHRQAIRELIARDKNHPCVVHLEHRQRAGLRHAGGARVLRAAGRRDAPARPDAAGRVRELHARHAGRDVISDLFDVLLLNRYYGWYAHTGDLVGRRAGAGGRAARVGGSAASRSS